MSVASLTTGIQSVTATGAVTPTAGVDISGITGDATVTFEVLAFDLNQTARIQLEDTVNAFTASIPVWEQELCGQIGTPPFVVGAYTPGGFRFSVRKYEIPDARFGVSGAKLRLNVTSLSGGTLSFASLLNY